MKLKSLLFALILSLLASITVAAQTSCPKHYLDGQAPDFLNQKLAQKTKEVCYSGYALINSGVTRTSLASAEHLMPGPHPKRTNAFHADHNIDAAARAELVDYRHSGYDRGHMAPSGDMHTAKAQYESFSLANMVPQNSNDNRHLWEGIEAATRDLAEKDDGLYVITGPVFHGSNLKQINRRVMVPTYIFKAIYDPRLNQAAAYIVKNAAGIRYAVVSISELEKLSGLAVFPQLPDDVKQKKMDLPKPELRGKSAIEDPALIPK